MLYVFDEVQGGVGRRGKMVAADYEGVEPYILLTAKGLGAGMPIGAMIVRESIDSWENGAHGSTFGGNPVCCAAALATLDLVEAGLMANAATMGQRMIAVVRAPESRYPCSADVRGRVLMGGVDFGRQPPNRRPATHSVHRPGEAAGERFPAVVPAEVRTRIYKDGKFFREVWANAFDPEVRIADYAKFGVDAQVISTVPVLFSYWAKPSQALELHRHLNDHTAEICRKYPRHYAGIGTVPLLAPTLAIQDMERCIDQLGLSGIQVG